MTNSSKTVETLVEDIYQLLQGSIEIDDSLVQDLANDIANTVRTRLSSSPEKRNHLSLSSVGKPLRKLWYDLNDPEEDVPAPPYSRLKFLYGDIIEDILLWLAKVSGHDVSGRQQEVKHCGVVGHIDSIIDGEVVDAKSASPRSYQKFALGTLPHDDPFGYLAQIASYDAEVGKGKPGFLAMNKVTGEICLYQPDMVFDTPNTEELIAKAKETIAKPTPPEERCYQPVPDGKSGNMKLDKGCCLCPYKRKCWQGLRAFRYSDGIRYLTTVVNEPKVEEIIYDNQSH